ncbi:MAG TPA: hypothetical protein EYQ50_01465 [Verrucomicrobiales bacterium]|nr:hypothetical protein [Verrucomicrobiales bacterium]HIL71551.1 hypothetical protein [Verrucomicrobiota bacterium]
MKRRRLLWQLFPTYLGITLVALIAATWYASVSFRQFYYSQVFKSLEVSVFLFEPFISRSLSDPNRLDLQELISSVGRRTEARITIIDAVGKVLGDSHSDPGPMDNHNDRPEIRGFS